MFQWNILAKNDEGSLAIPAGNSTLWIDQEAAVVEIDVVRRLCAGAPLHIVGADDHPDMMLAGETSHGFVSFFVVTNFFGDGCFGPKKQIDFVRERLL